MHCTGVLSGGATWRMHGTHKLRVLLPALLLGLAQVAVGEVCGMPRGEPPGGGPLERAVLEGGTEVRRVVAVAPLRVHLHDQLHELGLRPPSQILWRMLWLWVAIRGVFWGWQALQTRQAVMTFETQFCPGSDVKQRHCRLKTISNVNKKCWHMIGREEHG